MVNMVLFMELKYMDGHYELTLKYQSLPTLKTIFRLNVKLDTTIV